MVTRRRKRERQTGKRKDRQVTVDVYNIDIRAIFEFPFSIIQLCQKEVILKEKKGETVPLKVKQSYKCKQIVFKSQKSLYRTSPSTLRRSP